MFRGKFTEDIACIFFLIVTEIRNLFKMKCSTITLFFLYWRLRIVCRKTLFNIVILTELWLLRRSQRSIDTLLYIYNVKWNYNGKWNIFTTFDCYFEYTISTAICGILGKNIMAELCRAVIYHLLEFLRICRTNTINGFADILSRPLHSASITPYDKIP